MGGKHEKYAYVDRGDGWYVKVRMLKSREKGDPSRYIVVGFKTRRPPRTYLLLDLEELPEEVRPKLFEV